MRWGGGGKSVRGKGSDKGGWCRGGGGGGLKMARAPVGGVIAKKTQGVRRILSCVSGKEQWGRGLK